ncbi:MAG: hypothetical protein Q9181_002786 [Wetmoreana brouardii]
MATETPPMVSCSLDRLPNELVFEIVMRMPDFDSLANFITAYSSAVTVVEWHFMRLVRSVCRNAGLDSYQEFTARVLAVEYAMKLAGRAFDDAFAGHSGMVEQLRKTYDKVNTEANKELCYVGMGVWQSLLHLQTLRLSEKADFMSSTFAQNLARMPASGSDLSTGLPVGTNAEVLKTYDLNVQKEEGRIHLQFPMTALFGLMTFFGAHAQLTSMGPAKAFSDESNASMRLDDE